MFFGSDTANPDNYPHFYADLQMYNVGPTAPDPAWFMRSFLSAEVAARANKWQGRNVTRWRSDEYDRLYDAAETELDPVKRAALFVKMNDLLIREVVFIPVLWRNGVSASSLPAWGWTCRAGTRPSGASRTGTGRRDARDPTGEGRTSYSNSTAAICVPVMSFSASRRPWGLMSSAGRYRDASLAWVCSS